MMPALRAVMLILVLSLSGCACQEPGEPAWSAVCAADHPTASQAGADVLAQGGNAVDAAVAAAFTLSVVRPQSCGIGGGGFMVIWLPAEATRDGHPVCVAVSGREKCPAGIGKETFERHPDPQASTVGGLAVAVPGSVAGLLHAQQAYGRLDRAAVLAGAINAAEAGFVVDAAYADAAAATIRKFQSDAGLQDRFPFLWRVLLLQGRVRVGDVIRNPQQADALRLIAREGAAGFYRGPVADAIVRAATTSGGVLSHADLEAAAGHGVHVGPPLEGVALGRRVLTMPPPSSGGVALLQVLTMMEDAPNDETARAHRLVECFKLAFADRAGFMADPLFSDVPTEDLLDRRDMHARALMINNQRTFGPEYYTRGRKPVEHSMDHGTSHVSAVDRWGGACAATETINLHFGSFVCAEPFGFLLNNQMDDFTTRRGSANAFGLQQSDINLPEPGKRPLSSMTPTIVLGNDGHVEAVAGASGGPRIITATAQALLNALERGDNAPEALARPRLHHQWLPDRVWLEPLLMDTVGQGLASRGHTVAPSEGEAAVQLIVRRPAHGERRWSGASDPRKGGRPAGVE